MPPKVLLPFDLTERLLGVLQLMAEGKSNKEIAHNLTLSVYTVNSHVENILAKLDVENRTEAVAMAIKHGITTKPKQDDDLIPEYIEWRKNGNLHYPQHRKHQPGRFGHCSIER